MLTPDMLHDYQVRSVYHLMDHDHAALHLDMGLGKTAIVLTAIQNLVDFGVHKGTLVVAPLRPARVVWEREARGWLHTCDLSFSYVLGTSEERLRALMRPANIYIINYENLAWLAEVITHYFLRKGEYPPFDGVVWDESSKIKNAESKRVEGFLPIMPYIKRRIALTGTPASNGLKDLFGQYLMTDGGLRLGVDPAVFRDRFFHQIDAYNYAPDENAKDHIARVVSDITIELREEDYLQLPSLTIQDIYIELPSKVRELYDRMEMELFAELESGAELEVFNAASLTNKLLQLANGNPYIEPGLPEYETVHDLKLKELTSILEETGDEPVLLAYAYKADAWEIMKRYPDAVNLSGATDSQAVEIVQKFSEGKIKLLLGHPASMGHGIDGLQDSCTHMVWYGLNWSLELYQQFTKRVHRQGQKRPVVSHRILCSNTMDEAQAMRLEMKGDEQDDIRSAIHGYRNKT